MKTQDFIRGMVVAYMDVGKSSRQTDASISEIIAKHQKPNQIIDESIYSEFSISHIVFQTIYKQFTSTLSYSDQRINNGRQSIYEDDEKEEIGEYVLNNIGLSLKEITEKPRYKSKIGLFVHHETISKRIEYFSLQAAIQNITKLLSSIEKIRFCQQIIKMDQKMDKNNIQ